MAIVQMERAVTLCKHFTPITLGCCCPLDGCWTPPYFNWIIGVCKGSGCGNYGSTPATQVYKNVESQLIVNYVASYQWNSTTKTGRLLKIHHSILMDPDQNLTV